MFSRTHSLIRLFLFLALLLELFDFLSFLTDRTVLIRLFWRTIHVKQKKKIEERRCRPKVHSSGISKEFVGKRKKKRILYQVWESAAHRIA